MEFNSLLSIIRDEPVFSTGLLLAGNVDPQYIRKQLSRWVKSGKIIQLRRGVYTLAEPYQKKNPHPFVIANHLQAASYVSLQSALAFYGLIPEFVPEVTSVTTGRPEVLKNPKGSFSFRHIHLKWFTSFKKVELGNGQSAFIALPEKALLDLVYFEPDGGTAAYIRTLRLQNLEKFNLQTLKDLANLSARSKLIRAVTIIDKVVNEYGEYRNL
jgi:predicted transcriptional regulator of viral defense system